MSSCVFCRIVSGEIPASVVFEDDQVLAFRDLQPQAPLHVLVIPKKHVAHLGDIQPEDDILLGRMMYRAAAIARASGVEASGYRTVINTNRDAGQTVPHVHVHLLGGRAMSWPPG